MNKLVEKLITNIIFTTFFIFILAITATQLDKHQKYLIRKTEHSFFSANRIPTIDAVYREVQNN
jgi:hypothetical protein